MLPHRFLRLPKDAQAPGGALEFFSYYFPCGAVSGDFFDVLELPGNRVGVFICDVMGHDVRAALITAMVRALVEDFSAGAAAPGQLLAQVNRGLVGVFQHTGATLYATAFYMVADLARGELLYASAAHPEPLQLRRNQGLVEPLVCNSGREKGPALGLFDQAQFHTFQRPLAPGDLITMFTDGLIEVEGANHEHFDRNRLIAAMQQRAGLPANDLITELIAEVKGFAGQREFSDDVCIVGMEVKGTDNIVHTGAA
jgi:sigma-B regulation protein RsbU (phosphoserine phosphatase)